MSNNPYGAYLEARILSATPLELVRMLYEAALESIRAARRHLIAGEISERSRAVTRALMILTELATSLDHDAGGEFSQRLAALYDYIQLILLDANLQQTEAGLVESERLLVTLCEAWTQIAAAPGPAGKPAYAGASVQTAPAVYGDSAELAVHQWSA